MLLNLDSIFMTRDIGNWTHFHAVACREYTLPREDGSSQPRGWIQRIAKNWTRGGSYNQLIAW